MEQLLELREHRRQRAYEITVNKDGDVYIRLGRKLTLELMNKKAKR